MKQDTAAEWESRWMSQRQRDDILSRRLALEQARQATGWRRNFVALAVFVALVAIALVRHFS